MKVVLLGCSLFFVSLLIGQTNTKDAAYLEDQFYFGVNYNFLLNTPVNAEQQNLPYGVQFGFNKDIPLNQARNFGFGLGLGYALNSYYSNIRVTEIGGSLSYEVIDTANGFRRNKLETHAIEVPLQLRWRTSTASDYKFWRIYAGARFAYILGARSKFVSDQERISFFNTDIRKFRYGLALNFGFNTFNIHAYYALNNLFTDNISTVTGDPITIRPLRIGIIFYIL